MSALTASEISNYGFQTTFAKSDTQPADLGAVRTSHLDTNPTPNPLVGYTNGMAEVMVYDTSTATPTIVESPHAVLFEGVGSNGVHIQTDPTTNRMAATINFLVQDGEAINQIALQFGSLSGFSSASSAFIDDTRFGATEAPTSNPSTFDGTPVVRSQLFMVSSGTLGSVNIDGTQLCACEYLSWGYWSGEIVNAESTENQFARGRVHLATWVAGQLPGIEEIPTSGNATFAGHLVGNVVNGTSQYVTAGNFNHTWDFAQRTGVLNITNFDIDKNFTGGVTVPGNGRDFVGTFTAANAAASGIAGVYNGSFFKGGTDPTAAMGGQFTMAGGSYVAAGTFAAQKVPQP